MKKKNTKSNSLENLFRTALVSLTIISFFFISPIVIDFTKKKSFSSVDFENNSKNNLKKLLKKKRHQIRQYNKSKFFV